MRLPSTRTRRQWQGHARSQLLWYEAPAAALDDDEVDGGSQDGGGSASRAVDCGGGSGGGNSGRTGDGGRVATDGADCAAAQVVLGFQRVEPAPARSLLHNPLPNSGTPLHVARGCRGGAWLAPCCAGRL